MLFQQIKNAPIGAYSYILGDCHNRVCVVIDPVAESRDVTLALIDDLKLDLHSILLTHAHQATLQSAMALRNRAGGAIVLYSACSLPEADVLVEHGSHIAFGDEVIHVIGTPGHTRCSVCYRWRDRVFTGNALSCSEKISPEGDPGSLFDSVTTRLFTLPPETLVFPSVDTSGRTVSTIAEEKASNPCFSSRSRDTFVTLMSAMSASLQFKT